MHNRLKERLNIAPHDALLVLINHETGAVRRIWGKNIVTNEGDKWYAQASCSEVPTNTFANLYLATAGPGTPGKTDDYADFTVHAGSEKAKTAGYPKTNDGDADNTGAGVDIVTWKFDYSIADGPFVAITHCFIAKAGATGTDPILNSYKWATAWNKDAATSAKIFANHEMLGS
jgi:hypothetical protein